MSRRPQRNSAPTARLEAVRRQQRRNAHRRTAVIEAASIAMVAGVSVTAVGVTGHAEAKGRFLASNTHRH